MASRTLDLPFCIYIDGCLWPDICSLDVELVELFGVFTAHAVPVYIHLDDLLPVVDDDGKTLSLRHTDDCVDELLLRFG